MTVQILTGDCIEVMGGLEAGSVHCCVTSPPYWGLRDYGVDGQIGLEETPEEYVEKMVEVFREVKRVLRDDGTLWLNLGDSYNGQSPNRTGDNGYSDGRSNRDKRFSVGGVAGLKPKDLVGIPWRVAFALQADGWYLRSDIIWHKPNPMPEGVTDRPTKAHEYIFLLSKKERYYYDAEAIREECRTGVTLTGYDYEQQKAKTAGWTGPDRTGRMARKPGSGANGFNNPAGRNKRSVWTVATKPYAEAHFATFPPKLIQPCIKAGCPKGGMVLDPFGGAGTTGLVVDGVERDCILIELNEEYSNMAHQRIYESAPLFANIR
jgi:DNA modification methylase